jgi:hypothetical protein
MGQLVNVSGCWNLLDENYDILDYLKALLEE